MELKAQIDRKYQFTLEIALVRNCMVGLALMGAIRGLKRERWATRKLYVLWARDTQLFKIGIAASPRRVHDVQNCSPLNLILVGYRPGTIQDETAMHRKLGQYRYRGEWFKLPESIVWALARWVGRGDEVPSDVEVAKL